MQSKNADNLRSRLPAVQLRNRFINCFQAKNIKNKIDWKSVFFFFGDERNVLPDDEQSNFRMANENLFQPLQIADTNIFRWKTELENENEIAKDYETKSERFF